MGRRYDGLPRRRAADLVGDQAKPRPASPARAASTAAFKARMSVCKAISSMTWIMRAILLLEPSISFIFSTMRSRV